MYARAGELPGGLEVPALVRTTQSHNQCSVSLYTSWSREQRVHVDGDLHARCQCAAGVDLLCIKDAKQMKRSHLLC